MKIEKNEQFNGLEVYFDTKPEKETIEALKSRFFRWHGLKKCWYARNTEANLAFLQALNNGEQAEPIQATKQTKNKALIDEAGKIYGNGNEKDEKWFSSYLFDALLLEDGRILCIDKENIETRFCFHDEGPDYEFYKELHSEKEKMHRYFESENTKKLEREIEEIKEALEDFEEETEFKNIVFFYRQYIMDYASKIAGWSIQDKRHCYRRDMKEFEDAREATKEEIEALIDLKQKQLEDMKKRCSNWWKKYGAEKLHTWTYWADA